MLGAYMAAVAAVALGVPAPASAAAAPDDFTLYAKEAPADGDGPTGSGSPTESGSPTAEQEEYEPGDAFTFASDLYLSKTGSVVGRDGVTCTVVRTGTSSDDMLCLGNLVLNGNPGDGQIAAQGLASFSTSSDQPPAPFDIAITGGTGDYADARGYIRITDEGDGFERMEFHFSP